MPMQIDAAVGGILNRINQTNLFAPPPQATPVSAQAKAIAPPVATANMSPDAARPLAGEAEQAMAAIKHEFAVPGGPKDAPAAVHSLDPDRVARLLNFDDI